MTASDDHPEPHDARPGVQVVPRRGYLLALAVLVGSLLIVLAMWRAAYEREVAAAQARFVTRTDNISSLLRERLVNYELLVQGGAALFATVARPTPAQWRAYSDGMSLRSRFPGLVGLGFAAYVSHSQLPYLQMEWRDAGHGLLEITPHGVRSHYGPILLLEPRSIENLSAMGFDMFAEPIRHAAMLAALESGEPRLSGPVQLVQDGARKTVGLLLYLPVYRGGDRPGTVAARRDFMQGWIYTPFRVERYVDTALLGSPYRTDRFRIHDITDGQPALLFASARNPVDELPAFRHSSEIDHYGRRWRVDFDSKPLDDAAPQLRGLQNTLALGMFVSLLLYAIAWVLAHTEARAQKIAGRMTEDYRRSEERFRSAMHYSAIGTALLDSEGRIVEANPALCQIVGRDPDLLVGSPFATLFEDDDADPLVDLRKVSSDESGVHRSTRRLHRAGGLPRHVQLTYAPVPGNVGQDVSGLMQVEDVTERLRAEARAHALNRTLEARVALRTRELSQANQELETFAYSVSHDLRAPLRAIDGFSRLMTERYATQIDETGLGYLERVRKAASRMGELIDALLKMTWVTRGEFRSERVDLSLLAVEVVEELRAGDPVHRADVRIAPGLQVEGDPTLLRNLLGNLLGNAWKFTGGRDDARIEFGAADDDGGAADKTAFYVRDNGAGFDQAYVDKLFRPFQRLHGQGQFAGHGIGLASVKRIVERHGGTIRAEGREGEGATFFFTLPGVDGNREWE